MKENKIHKTADRAPAFPCYLWHAENETYIYATNASVFLPKWQAMYPFWHEDQADWPSDEPPKQ